MLVVVINVRIFFTTFDWPVCVLTWKSGHHAKLRPSQVYRRLQNLKSCCDNSYVTASEDNHTCQKFRLASHHMINWLFDKWRMCRCWDTTCKFWLSLIKIICHNVTTFDSSEHIFAAFYHIYDDSVILSVIIYHALASCHMSRFAKAWSSVSFQTTEDALYGTHAIISTRH